MLSAAKEGRLAESGVDAAKDSPERESFSPDQVAQLFQPWAGAQKILLAVSGGPDSVALMLLAAEWTRGKTAPPLLHVATVDHGLRPEARAEAETGRRMGAPAGAFARYPRLDRG